MPKPEQAGLRRRGLRRRCDNNSTAVHHVGPGRRTIFAQWHYTGPTTDRGSLCFACESISDCVTTWDRGFARRGLYDGVNSGGLMRNRGSFQGESAAGGRLLQLLDILDARDVCVVVSRWCDASLGQHHLTALLTCGITHRTPHNSTRAMIWMQVRRGPSRAGQVQAHQQRGSVAAGLRGLCQ